MADRRTAAGRSLRRITWLVLGSWSVFGAGVAGSAHAQFSQPSPPPLTTLRYDEDYASLRDPAARTGAWWEPLKYIPLNKTGDVYVTVGAELRLRYEGFENNTWTHRRDAAIGRHLPL